MPKVSVIIPVYNVEEYFTECLDSIKNQTFKDFEVICINDGSTDNSLEILTQYANTDKRFKVFSQENQGVSAARNKGIELAKGEYIAFLDPDDWWSYEILEKAVNKISAENPDILVFGFCFFKNNQIIPNSKYLDELNRCATENNPLNKPYAILHYSWDKIYKKEFLENRKIRYPLGLHPVEDTLFTMECLYYKPKLSYLAECLQYYRFNRPNSAMTRNMSIRNAIKGIRILLNKDFFKNSDNEYKRITASKLIGGLMEFYIKAEGIKLRLQNYIDLIKFVPELEGKLSEEVLRECKNYHKMKKRVSFSYIMEKIFSVKNQYRNLVKHKVITILGFKISFRINNSEKNN